MWVPTFVRVLINVVVVVIKMGAYIHGVLILVGAYYPNFTIWSHSQMYGGEFQPLTSSSKCSLVPRLL